MNRRLCDAPAWLAICRLVNLCDAVTPPTAAHGRRSRWSRRLGSRERASIVKRDKIRMQDSHGCANNGRAASEIWIMVTKST